MKAPWVLCCIMALLPFAGWTLAVPTPEEGKVSPELLKTRVEAPSTTYRLLEVGLRMGQPGAEAEKCYRWSCRWLEAARALPGADAKALAETHLERMKNLEASAKRLAELGTILPVEAAGTTFYRLEAEIWVAQNKAP